MEELNRRFEEAKPNIRNYLAPAVIPLPNRDLTMRYDELLNSCALGLHEIQANPSLVTTEQLLILERFILAFEEGARRT